MSGLPTIYVDGHGPCELWVLPKVAPKKQREGKYVPESFIHPAKMDTLLCRKIIETYTRPGDLILDPMAGIGTTGIEAALLGRNCIMVELEPKFVEITRKNIGLLGKFQRFGPIGRAEIIQGDARELAKLLSGKADSIITSPPYSESIQGSGADTTRKRILEGKYKGLRPDVWFSKGNIAGSTFGDGYSKNPNNIGNLPHGKIDSIITSPPYEEGMGVRRHATPNTGRSERLWREKRLEHYPHSKNQIGAMKKETYLEAMLKVLQNCWEVLRPGGRMVLVLKRFVRSRRVVKLDLDIRKLCEMAGFVWEETKLFKLPSRSFWRILYRKKFGDSVPELDTLDYEFVMCFRKPPLAEQAAQERLARVELEAFEKREGGG